MQPDRFTIKAQEAVQAAQRLADERRNPQTTPEHLLAVLLEQPEGSSSRCYASWASTRRWRARRRRRARGTADVSAGGAERLRGPASCFRSCARAESEMRALRTSTSRPSTCCSRSPRIPARPGEALRAAGASRTNLLRRSRRSRPHRVTDQNPEDKFQALEKYGTDLTEAAEKGKLDPVIGRDDEIRRVIQVLAAGRRTTPC